MLDQNDCHILQILVHLCNVFTDAMNSSSKGSKILPVNPLIPSMYCNLCLKGHSAQVLNSENEICCFVISPPNEQVCLLLNKAQGLIVLKIPYLQ